MCIPLGLTHQPQWIRVWRVDTETRRMVEISTALIVAPRHQPPTAANRNNFVRRKHADDETASKNNAYTSPKIGEVHIPSDVPLEFDFYIDRPGSWIIFSVPLGNDGLHHRLLLRQRFRHLLVLIDVLQKSSECRRRARQLLV